MFLRFALLMNLALLVLWLLLVVMPFWAKPPVTFRWNQITSYSAKHVIQGYGLDSSFIVYGEPLMLSRYVSSVCASHGNSGGNASCNYLSDVELHPWRAESFGMLAGGYNYLYRDGQPDPDLGIPDRHQPIPADLGFPIAIVAMLVLSLIMLLHAIGSHLKVYPVRSI